ncbi:MAG: hypothetical protein ACLFUB_04175 [Cyclobacteriaceae bacterium]
MDYQRKILGILFILAGALFILFMSFASALVYTLPFDQEMATIPDFVRLIGLAGSLSLILFLGLPSLVTGIALLLHKRWAEQLILPLGCFYLLFFPMGTAVGIYSLVVYFGRRKEKQSVTHEP